VDARRGKEVFVDEALMSQMGKTASRTYEPPHTLALVTGDGNNNFGRASFPEHIDTALLHGWHVELYSWRGSVSGVYRQYAKAYPAQFKVIYLDDELLPLPAAPPAAPAASGSSSVPVLDRKLGGSFRDPVGRRRRGQPW
jgi:hypothetical protein